MKVPVLITPSSALKSKNIIHRKVAEFEPMPPQINPDPNKANWIWLKDHDPRICVYMRGTDPDGNPIIAYIVDFASMRTNVWQDLTEGANHSRYPWPLLDYNNYWLSDLHLDEAAFNLIHETVEDRKMADRHIEKVYDDAHSYTANPAEFIARHDGDIVKALESLGWVVDFPDEVRTQNVSKWR
jgi:hypothetical protein